MSFPKVSLSKEETSANKIVKFSGRYDKDNSICFTKKKRKQIVANFPARGFNNELRILHAFTSYCTVICSYKLFISLQVSLESYIFHMTKGHFCF